MTVQEQLQELMDSMPDGDRQLLLEFARFLNLRKEHDAWRRFGLDHFARAYGDDEPEYDEADIRSELGR